MLARRLALSIFLLAPVGALAQDTPLACTSSSGRTYSSCLERGGARLSVKPSVLRSLAFSEGLAALWAKDLGWMYVDKRGKVLVQGVAAVDNGPEEFHEGLVRVERGGKCGFADRKGRVRVPLDYDGCLNFEKAAARVCVKCRLECQTKDCEHSALKGGEWRCVNASGARVACAP